jgi:hypothetical protein
MTLPIPLAVMLVNADGGRHITADLHDLSFRSVVPGGFASARFTLSQPLTHRSDEIGYYTRVIIGDKRNGRTVWEGRLEDPGRSAGGSGEILELAAVGPSAHASDLKVPRIWTDRRLDGAWITYETKSRANAKTEFTQDGAGNPVIRLGAPPGTGVITANWRASMIYRAMRETSQRIARVRIGWDSGFSSVGWQIAVFSHNAGDGETTVDSDAANTAGGELLGVYVTDIPEFDDAIEFLMSKATSGDADDTTWAIGLIYCVRAVLHDATGDALTTGYTVDTVLASEVVTDLLGTLLPHYDGLNAVVDATSFGIDQLAYPDATTAAVVLDDLIQLEPTFYWAAWESTVLGTELYFDARTDSDGVHTGDFTWTHNPNTPLKGVLVFVLQFNVAATNEVNGITYGGVAMQQVPLSPLIHAAGAEDATLYAYHLGTGIPWGRQTVAVDVDATGSTKFGLCIGLYGDTVATAIEDTSTLDSAGIANPSAALATTVRTFVAAMLSSGHDAVSSFTPGTGYSEIAPGTDIGAQTGSIIISDAMQAAGTPTPSWTAASEEAGVLAVAIRAEPLPRHRFEWREWPTTVAYDASTVDGYSSTGSAEGLNNQVVVRYHGGLGPTKTEQASQVVQALTDAGLTRNGYLDLGDEVGSLANATRAAQQFLTDHRTAPNQGRLTVARPIYDHDLGMMIQPWEIRPGKLIRVRGILASSDALNATSRDGVTVFKVIGVDYDTSSASAILELDSQPLSLTHLLARITTQPVWWQQRRR